MEIKAVKLYENGFMTQPFAMGLEDGEDKFDKSVKYRSTLQNFLIDTGRETFTTGYQEQAYLEPQGVAACWDAEEGKVTVYGSMQCPYYVHGALMRALNLDAQHVRVVQEVTGGGFGGKEDYPSLLAC